MSTDLTSGAAFRILTPMARTMCGQDSWLKSRTDGMGLCLVTRTRTHSWMRVARAQRKMSTRYVHALLLVLIVIMGASATPNRNAPLARALV